MFVNLRLDQFLKSDVIRKRRLRAIESSDLREIGLRAAGAGGVFMSRSSGSVSLREPPGLIDKHLPQKLLMDLGGAFNDLHDLGITVIPRNRG